MKITIIGAAKPGYVMSVQEALEFSGRAAGICYMKDDWETLCSEDSEKITPFILMSGRLWDEQPAEKEKASRLRRLFLIFITGGEVLLPTACAFCR